MQYAWHPYFESTRQVTFVRGEALLISKLYLEIIIISFTNQ